MPCWVTVMPSPAAKNSYVLPRCAQPSSQLRQRQTCASRTVGGGGAARKHQRCPCCCCPARLLLLLLLLLPGKAACRQQAGWPAARPCMHAAPHVQPGWQQTLHNTGSRPSQLGWVAAVRINVAAVRINVAAVRINASNTHCPATLPPIARVEQRDNVSSQWNA
jgi:hypothetical protein